MRVAGARNSNYVPGSDLACSHYKGLIFARLNTI
jgi:hypothetical protein